MKQHPNWNLTQPSPGTFVLTTPSGRTFTREPSPCIRCDAESASPILRGMKLPRGIVGSNSPIVDAAAFRGACHHAARKTRGRVGRFAPAGVTPIFHSVEMHFEDLRLAVICHLNFPWLAIAEIPPFLVLDGADLEAELEDAHLAELTDYELELIEYWRPSKVGEVVFNYWD